MAVGILRIFAAENLAHVGLDAAAEDQFLDARADDIVFKRDTVGFVLGAEEPGLEFLEHSGDSGEEAEFGTQLAELGVARAVGLQVVEERLEVGQFMLVAVLIDKLAATLPELFPVDAEVRKNRLLLHVIRAQGLVVIIDDGDGALRNRHGFGARSRALAA